MSLIGALLTKVENKTDPVMRVPLVGRGGGGFFSQFQRQAGTSTHLSAMEAVGTVFGIVDKLATSIAGVEWHLYKKAKSGKKEDRVEVTSHACIDLWQRPNKFMTRQELVEAGQQHQELTGETWLVIGKAAAAKGLPLELWPIRPDRMEPVPDPETYLAGYLYRSPSGELVPLELGDVLFMRRPDPNNPYRGLGPLRSVMVDVDSLRYSAEWNRNFFLNSAEPGGIIEVPKTLTDGEFNQLRDRWNEQHRGIANGHRVALLELGKWVDRGRYSHHEMEFTQLHGQTTASIREAFGFPKFLTGDVTDVNRANADASLAMYAQLLEVPRLERWKQMLNVDLLPMYGSSAAGLEWDYDSPVPADADAENAARTSKVQAAASLLGLTTVSFDPKATLAAFDLPDIPFEKPATPPTPAPSPSPGVAPPPDGGQQDAGMPPDQPPADQLMAHAAQRLIGHVRGHNHFAGAVDPAMAQARSLLGLAGPVSNQAPPDDPALRAVQADWQSALDGLVSQWQSQVTPAQRQQINAQVARAVEAGDVAGLSQIAVDSGPAAAVLLDGLNNFAGVQSQRMADELVAQGAPASPVDAGVLDAGGLSGVSQATAGLLAAALSGVAAREAVKAYRPGVTAAVVVAAVDKALDGLSTNALSDQLGGALSRAQNVARLLTARELEISTGGSPGDPNNPDQTPPGADDYVPQVKYIASERNDSGTCWPCHNVDGTEYDSWIAAWVDYGGGIYRGCEGGWRCRGTIKARWNPAYPVQGVPPLPQAVP